MKRYMPVAISICSKYEPYYRISVISTQATILLLNFRLGHKSDPGRPLFEVNKLQNYGMP